MIDVGVAQDHGIDVGDVDREIVPITLFVVGATLDKAALEQDGVGARAEHVERAGHFAGGAEKLQ